MTTSSTAKDLRPRPGLRRARMRRGWSQAYAASEVHRLGLVLGWDLGVDERAISRWERGVVEPGPKYVTILCRLYELSAERLDCPPVELPINIQPPIERPSADVESRLARSTGGAEPASQAAPGTIDQQTPAIQEDNDTRRRTFVLGSIAAILKLSADPALKAIERIRQLDGIPAGETIDSLDELVADLGMASLRLGAENQYSRIDSAIEYVDGLMSLDHLQGTHRRRLLSVAGWLLGLAANAQLDLGDVAAARANCRAALSYGKRAEDPRLVAWASDRHAKVAFYTRDFRAVLAHTQHGLSVVPRPTGIEVGLLGASARAYARLGDKHRAMDTLREAQAEYDRLPASEVGGGLFLISEVYQAACASETTVWLDEPELTRRYALDVIRYFNAADALSRRPTRLAIAQLDLATALAQDGKPDEASHLGVLALNTERMASSVAARVADLDSTLQTRWRDVPEVRDFHEQHQHLAAAPGARALPSAIAGPSAES